MELMGRKAIILILVFLMGCAYGGSPYVKSSSSAYSSIPENSYSFVCRFHVVDPPDKDDHIKVSAADEFTRTYFDVTQIGDGNDVWVNVTVKTPLDRETLPNTVKASFRITDNQQNAVAYSHTIYIIDVNDNAPEFKNTPYNLYLFELPCKKGTTVYTNITAEDKDSNENGRVRYSMNVQMRISGSRVTVSAGPRLKPRFPPKQLPSSLIFPSASTTSPVAQSAAAQLSYRETFSINSLSGEVTLNKCLDYESNNYYQFTIIAKDSGTKIQLNNTAEFIIRVKDVQDMPPFFTRDSYRQTIKEEEKVGYEIIIVNARDGDPGVSNRVNYSLANSTCQGLFDINATSGQISTLTKVDRDTLPINITGNCVLTIETQEIETSNEKNYNTTSATTTVTITVKDINDNRPTFGKSSYYATVKENTPEDVPVKLNSTIFVSDIDQGENADIVITLENPDGTSCENFTASPSEIQGSGRVMILVKNASSLDYEKLKNTTISVVASGKNKKSFTDKVTLYISIQDMNDNSPQFNNTSFDLKVDENAKNGTFVNQITATDADSSPKFKIKTYSISGGSNRFQVGNTGVIRTECNNCEDELDREKQADYYMTLFATDWGGSKSSVVLHVTLTDVNDNSPIFSRQVYTSFIEENSLAQITKLEASDRDQKNTSNSKFTFSILNSTELANFIRQNLTINNKTGEISLRTPLDYESLQNAKGEVNITVKVSDHGQTPLSTTAVVQLTVQDKNDNQPYFNSTMYRANIAENETSTAGQKKDVAQVYAYDNDVTEQNKKLNYFKVGGSDKFTIDASTGIISIQINAKLDRETEPMYNLSIIAIDQGSPPQTGNATVSIDVTDVNDEPPSFGYNPQYTTSVTENTTVHGYIVYDCTATDPDSDNELFYSIIKISGVDETGKPVANSSIMDYFDIHPRNGSVYVNATLDRETAQTITLKIQVLDNKAVLNTPQTDTATLTITLRDVNDNKPVFDANSYNISVREDRNDGSPLITIHATDKDKNRTITYNLLSGRSPTGSFSIDNTTGLLTKTGELDREKTSGVSLHVLATDDGVPSLSASVRVYVDIQDFNDNSPVFENISNVNDIHMKENVPTGEELLDINATDDDEGPNKNITYFMDPNEHFEIEELTGVIYVTESPDREATPKIHLRIIAKDNPLDEKVQKSGFMTLTVVIDDVNDNCPTFDNDEYSARVEEDKPVESVIIQVTASDQDEKNTNNSKITYEIVDTFDNKFAVDKSNGKIKISSSLIDFVDIYRLQIIAYDQGIPQRNGTAHVNITVTDKNRHPPVIRHNLPEGNKLKIYECAIKGTVIHTFNYTDGDKDLNAEATFNISVLQDNITGVFTLSPTGELKVAGKLDVNVKAKYQFGIVATDKGEPPLSSEVMKITIDVIDVNDHLPSFKLPKVSWSIDENSSKGTIGTVTAVDEDKDSKPCYKLESQEWMDSFNVDKDNGHIFNVKPIDRECTPMVSFNVTVADCSIKKNVSDVCNANFNSEIEKIRKQTNDTIEVTIHVIDIDDNPPVFKLKHLATGMRRNTEPDTELELKLRNESYISDADTPQNGILSWTFSNDGPITISSELQTKIKSNSGATPCDDGVNHIFCVTKNGTIVNNKFFNEDLSGFVILSVKVADKAGNDTANITIYLISDTQIVTMTIRDNTEMVASFKDALLSKLSEILGYSAVFDSLQDHKENGVLNPESSDLKFHVVVKETQAVLSGKDAIELFDKQANNREMITLQNKYNVLRVSQPNMVEADADAGSKKLTFILVAVSVAEALIITIIIFLALSARNKFRRKLKAANINTPDMEMHVHGQKEVAIPGSNLYSKQNNPLLNADIDPVVKEANVDDDSIASSDDINLDENVVDDHNTVYDRMEEKEATLDMYNDDTFHSVSSEDLLNATLNLHALRKSRESLDKIDGDDDYLHETNHSPNTAAAFINEAFTEDLESTEI